MPLFEFKCTQCGYLNRKTVPGNRPYRPAMQPCGAATATDPETCSQCGVCAASCPVQCIQMVDDMPRTWQDGCIWCMACIQACPTGARKIVLPKIDEIARRLHGACHTRREPEIFYPLEK